jgi:endonuclease YncB( thermonuclease family)
MQRIGLPGVLSALILGLSCLLAAPRPAVDGAAARKTALTERVLRGRASVVDGDTLELHGARIRLSGIDAPEAAQTCRIAGKPWPCGRRAAQALAERIGARTVTCRWRKLDRYRRPIAVCRIGGEDLGAWMVANGWALAFRRYGTAYVAQEDAARTAPRGVWAGSFEPPWAYRAGKRQKRPAA